MTTPFCGVYNGKRILLTGHTGFKGAWLAHWLLGLGADVTGYALPPPTTPSLFEGSGMARRLRSIEGDVQDGKSLADLISRGRFDFVFHLAAQPLVRSSYTDPAGTFAVNVMGTAALLEAVRLARRPCVVLVITTDKCYENREWLYGYREEDPLGGHDPYSASKAAAELVVSSWRRSFFQAEKGILLASARAGNVIGPGDWALDRVVPDSVRALQRGAAIPVRNKVSTRPWQHVLEPLAGYLTLAAELAVAAANQNMTRSVQLASAFNFGPPITSNRTVGELVAEILKHWSGKWEDQSDLSALHEAGKLNLATDKAHHLLGWNSRWDFPTTVARTVEGYREFCAASGSEDVLAMMNRQITAYEEIQVKGANSS